MPRRVHRWKSFWFGILILGFLGWAWIMSNQPFQQGFTVQIPGRHWMFCTNTEGGVCMHRVEIENPAALVVSSGRGSTIPAQWFPGFQRPKIGPHSGLTIPHWAFFYAFAFLWGTALACRWLRRWKPEAEEVDPRPPRSRWLRMPDDPVKKSD
jgi:hypothetical protein